MSFFVAAEYGWMRRTKGLRSHSVRSRAREEPFILDQDQRNRAKLQKGGVFWLPLSNMSSTAVRLGGHAYMVIEYNNCLITSADSLRTTPVTEDRSSSLVDTSRRSWDMGVSALHKSLIKRARQNASTSLPSSVVGSARTVRCWCQPLAIASV